MNNKEEKELYEKVALAIFCLIAGVSIIESSYLALNGHHIFRQADAYGYILGILEKRDFNLFDLFSSRGPEGNRAVFDLPLYEYLIASVSYFFNKDPLVAVRYFNLFLWAITAFFGYRFCKYNGYSLGGLIFVGLLSTSPLFLHYYSVPLPDIFAIALSVMATAFLLDVNRTWRGVLLALILIALASAVKSPIPFIFLVFTTVYQLLSSLETKNEPFVPAFLQSKWFVFLFLISCFFVVALIEYYRSLLMLEVWPLHHHPWEWYFGSMELRLSVGFWKEMASRFNNLIPPYFLTVFFIVSILSIFAERKMENVKVIISAMVAFFAGWLTFSNLYNIHDYYELPVAIVIFMSFSISVSHLLNIIIKTTEISNSMGAIFPMIFVLVLFIQRINQDSYSMKVRTDFFGAMEYSIRHESIFLLVSNTINNPTIGGLVSTKFFVASPEEFESNCVKYLNQYRSILVESSHSECIEKHKMYSTHYFSDDGKIYFRSNHI